ncbi:hypothetical protein ACC794_37160, partial [Rhizobium ruizarguesonis]
LTAALGAFSSPKQSLIQTIENSADEMVENPARHAGEVEDADRFFCPKPSFKQLGKVFLCLVIESRFPATGRKHEIVLAIE